MPATISTNCQAGKAHADMYGTAYFHQHCLHQINSASCTPWAGVVVRGWLMNNNHSRLVIVGCDLIAHAADRMNEGKQAAWCYQSQTL
jgi:hypothetical protein